LPARVGKSPFQVKLSYREENSLMQLPRAFAGAHRAMGDRLRWESHAKPNRPASTGRNDLGVGFAHPILKIELVVSDA
jgi:hypothetical protein